MDRKKIPVTGEEWRKLIDISQQMKDMGVNAAPGQVASILLRCSLESVSPHSPSEPGETHDLEETADRILAAAASAGVSLAGMRPVALELLHRMQAAKAQGAGGESR